MADLDQLVDEFLRQEFEESPVSASGAGPDEFDDRLDEPFGRGVRRRQAGPPNEPAIRRADGRRARA